MRLRPSQAALFALASICLHRDEYESRGCDDASTKVNQSAFSALPTGLPRVVVIVPFSGHGDMKLAPVVI